MSVHGEYLPESPLPEGWSAPGPFEQVVEKEYPATRLAVTEKKGFMTLFRHISRKDIPMTAPVVMAMDVEKMKREDMQFLYQSTEVGEVGADGQHVVVKDVAKIKALTYAWIGRESKENQQKAKSAISAELLRLGIKATVWRYFSYNSPFKHPKDKRCYELQAVISEGK